MLIIDPAAVAVAGQAVELVDGVGIFIITSFVLFSILFKIVFET